MYLVISAQTIIHMIFVLQQAHKNNSGTIWTKIKFSFTKLTTKIMLRNCLSTRGIYNNYVNVIFNPVRILYERKM